MALIEALLGDFGTSTIWVILTRILQISGPVWIAFLFGIALGWAWKPRWANSANSDFRFSAPPVVSGSPTRSITAPGSEQNLNSCKITTQCLESFSTEEVLSKQPLNSSQIGCADSSAPNSGNEVTTIITDEDLEHLRHLVERRDGGPYWKHVMDRSTDSMSYQAWTRDTENGPPQYCSRTVYKDATPELLRDFFWDDEFRLKWDDMFIHAGVLEECPSTGTMVVHWIRKFPFFCSDREYLIGRRIWDAGRSYYCVTKGVPHSSVPKKDKPRRVDVFYSSWLIQAVESRASHGECEVILFHHEDMGIPWEIMKFGVRHGMWGAVKTIERGFRAYQSHRASGAALSHQAMMAGVNTKVDPSCLEGDEHLPEAQPVLSLVNEKPEQGLHLPKLAIIVGGVFAIACTLDRGLLAKTAIFDVARRFGNIARRRTAGTR